MVVDRGRLIPQRWEMKRQRGGFWGGDGRVGKRPVVAFLMAVAAGRRNGHPFGFGLRKVNVAL